MAAITPPTKRSRTHDAGFAGVQHKIRGVEDRSVRHDVTKYVWWASHEGSCTSADRTFATRRMALMYVAKRNSEEISTFVEAEGRAWANYFANDGHYALRPNAPFSLSTFADLRDEEIEAYANALCDAFSRHKVARGTSYRYAPRESDEMDEAELLRILSRDRPTKEEQEHHKRQALLLSDIAGFD